MVGIRTWTLHFQTALKGRIAALVTVGNSLLNRRRQQIIDRSVQLKLPSMYDSSLWIESGGLISYSSDDTESYRRAALIVDKILKGTKPHKIPVEQPTKFELAVNLRTAKQIGVAIPASLLARADRVIK